MGGIASAGAICDHDGDIGGPSMLLPIAILPRPSILTSVVVATSVAAGLAFGVAAGGVIVIAASAARSR